MSAVPGPVVVTTEDEAPQECELFGVFGIFIQFILACICTGALVIKKFLPGETRTWKVFCLDIWKQLLTAAFAHLLNLILAVYLQELTKEGNGCVWYLITMMLDCLLGMGLAYIFFKIVDEMAIKFGIETLKSGVYTDKEVPVDDDEIDPDEYVNLRTWFIQVIVWCMCTLLAKFFVFFFQLAYHKELVAVGETILIVFKGHPQLELVAVMVILPVVMNTLMFWVQDFFLKGDKHLDARRAEQEAQKRREREERRERMYNMGKGNVNVAAAEDQLNDESEDEFGNVIIKKRIARQIEEGVYGQQAPKRAGSIYEQHDDLDAVDEDEFDRIIDNERAMRRQSKNFDKRVADQSIGH